MNHVFASVNTETTVIDPQTRKPVGKQNKPINRAFPEDATIAELADWARSLGASAALVSVETVKP